MPLGVRQKGILATCNYVARARGVVKLSQLSAAKKACPELVVVDGEDLTPFRGASKMLYHLLKSHSWNGKVERLGLDEVFMGMWTWDVGREVASLPIIPLRRRWITVEPGLIWKKKMGG